MDIRPQGPGLGSGVTLETVNMLPQVQGLGLVYHGDRGPENPGARSVKFGYCGHDTTVQGQGGWVIWRMWACDPRYNVWGSGVTLKTGHVIPGTGSGR